MKCDLQAEGCTGEAKVGTEFLDGEVPSCASCHTFYETSMQQLRDIINSGVCSYEEMTQWMDYQTKGGQLSIEEYVETIR